MDKELSNKEKRSIKLRRALPWAAGVVAFGLLIVAVKLLADKSVYAKDLHLCTVDVGTIHTSVSASGKVAPALEEIITSPISSRIIEVYCKAGDSVVLGTPILKLDLLNTETELNQLRDQISIKQYEHEQQVINDETEAADMEIRIQVKEMSVNQMKVEWENEKNLDSIGSGTGDRVREAEMAYKTGVLELKQMRQQLQNKRRISEASGKVKGLDMSIAMKKLDQMERKLSDAQIRSPRKATLTFVADQIGQKIGEGEKIAVISDLSHFKIDGEISDALGDRISVGSLAMVKIGKVELEGTVANLTPLSRNGVFEFSVRLNEDQHPRLRSGLRADVFVMQDVRDDVMRIKNAAFYRGQGLYTLFVRDGDRLVRRDVELGACNYDYIEVISGLNPGDEVVISDMGQYTNHTAIKLK